VPDSGMVRQEEQQFLVGFLELRQSVVSGQTAWRRWGRPAFRKSQLHFETENSSLTWGAERSEAASCAHIARGY